MNFFIVSGSSRIDSQSIKVANYFKACIEKILFSSKATILDMSTINIPNWNEELWVSKEAWDESWLYYSNILLKSDAIIIITPEWDGMVPALIKNFFLLCSNKELFHKPALIVSISSGAGGAYPVAELRMSSYKNTKICYIPDHIIIKNVKCVLNNLDVIDNEEDKYIKDRIEYTLKLLHEYADCFSALRKSEVVCSNQYIYGM